MSSTNAPQLKDDQVVQLYWKDLKGLQDELKAYRGLVRVLSQDLSDAKKELKKERERVDNMIRTSEQRGRVLDELLDTNRQAVSLAVEVRSELIKVKYERNELLRKLQQLEGQR